jgi:hypothetical protein
MEDEKDLEENQQMSSSRSAAVAEAKSRFDDERFLNSLRKLVASPTESHPPTRKSDLEHCCKAIVGPMIEAPGFQISILENPMAEHVPVLPGTRFEYPPILVRERLGRAQPSRKISFSYAHNRCGRRRK